LKKILLLLTLTSTLLFPVSFDCKKAKTDVEKLICSDKELLAYQKDFENKYNLIMDFYHDYSSTGQIFKPEIISQEIYPNWLEKRNKCQTKKCLQEFYKTNTIFFEALIWSLGIIKKNYQDSVRYSYEGRTDLWSKETERIAAKIGEKFYSDLSNNFTNITIIEPIAQMVSYDDERLKKGLGSCYYMEMNLAFDRMTEQGEKKYANATYYTLWKTDIDGDAKEDMLLAQVRYGEEIVWNLLDENDCKKAVGKTNFDPIKDRVIRKIDYMKHYGLPLLHPFLINYESKKYNEADHTKANDDYKVDSAFLTEHENKIYILDMSVAITIAGFDLYEFINYKYTKAENLFVSITSGSYKDNKWKERRKN
jgi:hypothetical protein